MMGSPVVVVVGFFSFFQNFGFSGCSWGIRKKMAQNDKKFSQSCPISQDPFIIWLSFVVRKCKIIKSPGLFFIFFKIMIFWVVRRVKGQKMAQNGKKLCRAFYLKSHISYDLHLWYTCVKWWHTQLFFSFLKKFWLYELLGGKKGKK